jgi:hypothetical protein
MSPKRDSQSGTFANTKMFRRMDEPTSRTSSPTPVSSTPPLPVGARSGSFLQRERRHRIARVYPHVTSGGVGSLIGGRGPEHAGPTRQ